MAQSEKVYSSTANPHNRKNIQLHRMRFRQDDTINANGDLTLEEKKEQFDALYAEKDWSETHMPLEDLDVIKFTISLPVQRLLYKMQVCLADQPYAAFGKTPDSWDGYTLMYRNGFPSGDHRKPVTLEFEKFWLEVYCPIMFTMIFGSKAYETEIKEHVSQFKSCTIKVTESDTVFYGDNVFHMHIDGKIGMMQRKNYSQSHMSRMLFSIVTDTLGDIDRERCKDREYGTTCYPVWQPKVGFHSNREFHKYMRSLYIDRGLENSGLPRPHYQIPEDMIYRACTGEVLWHNSHADESGPQAVHSEPNPCPDRHLFVFDFKNLIHRGPDGKFLPSTEIPMDVILGHMKVLGDCDGQGLVDRMADAAEVAKGLMDTAAQYPEGKAIVESLLKILGDF